MTTIYLKEFIKTGKFGTISIGSTKADVINLMGNKFAFADCGDTQIMKYGWYEFFYWTETEVVFGVQNDHLVSDCSNHPEMINYKNKQCTIDKWILKDNENITFGEIENHLRMENIDFEIIPAYKGSAENVIKCTNSRVTFDFVNEYSLAEINEKGKFINWKEVTETNLSSYVLNGIRLFEY